MVSTLVVTHSGPFHADDVLAFALIRRFLDPDATVRRTRDPSEMPEDAIWIDVGGIYDPVARRFDHHQRDYRGPKSSAGMVLDWLEGAGRVDASLAANLRTSWIDYVDAVDNGAQSPDPSIPCFSSVVALMAERSIDLDVLNRLYLEAATFAEAIVAGHQARHATLQAAIPTVRAAMKRAEAADSNVLVFESYLKWKPAYFACGGATHGSEFVVFPGDNGWRVVTVPVGPDTFEDKKKLPAEWAGLSDQALSDVVGVAGAKFCHKNRFIAVFDTRDHLRQALEKWNVVMGRWP